MANHDRAGQAPPPGRGATGRPRLSPEEKARIADEKAVERKAMIKKIVDEAPPFSMQQIAVLSRIFEGSAEWMRQRAAEKAAEKAASASESEAAA